MVVQKTTIYKFLGVCNKSGGGFHGPCSSCSTLYGCARTPGDTYLGRRLGLVSSTSAAPQSGVVVPIHALQQQMRFISSSLVFFLPACESDLTVLHTFSHAQSLQGILYTRKPPLDLLHTPKNLSIVVTPRACARGKVIGFVCLSVCLSSSSQKSPDLEF